MKLLCLSIACLLCAIAALMCMGCSTLDTRGFEDQHLDFRVRVHVVDSEADFPEACQNRGWDACFTPPNHIWVFGMCQFDECFLWVNERLLGHELRHVLAHQYPRIFEDPDIFDKQEQSLR